MPNLMDLIVTVNGTLIPAPQTVANLGEVVAFVLQGVVPGAEAFTVATTADVDDLLTATNITTDASNALKFMLAQNKVPYIRVITYVTTDVVGAFATMKLQTAWDPGVIYFRGINDVAADLEDIYDFASATENKWKFYYEVESPNTGLYGASKPVALVDLEAIETVGVTYVADDVTGTANGGAFAAIMGGQRMVGVGGHPLASRVSIKGGADVAALTTTQWSNLVGNDAKAVIQLDAGSSASERIMHGLDVYYGNSFTSTTTFILALKLARLGIKELIQKKADLNEPIQATASGIALVQQSVYARVFPMVEAKHFVENTDYPLGYKVSCYLVGDEIFTDLYVRTSREIRRFTLNAVGEVV